MKKALPTNTPKPKASRTKSGNYGSLSPLLIAEICLAQPKYEDGMITGFEVVPNSATVRAILTEADFNLENQYSNPFEGQNADRNFSTLAGMLQTGELVDATDRIAGGSIDSLKTNLGAIVKKGGVAAIPAGMALAGLDLVDDGIDDLRKLRGRSAFTKLNSTMVYLGTQPVKMSCTLFFRAWQNAYSEVEQQIQRLQEWASPISLSQTGMIENLLSAQKKNKGLLGSFFPSEIPPFVSLKYGGLTYLPLMIESISAPLVVERDENGNRLAVTVQCSFAGRQAWDKGDIRRLYRSRNK